MDFPYEFDLPNMHKSPRNEEEVAQRLIDAEEAKERRLDAESRSKAIVLQEDELRKVFCRFLAAEADPLIAEKRAMLAPIVTRAAQKALQESLYDFTADLVAQVDFLTEECDSLWRRRFHCGSLDDLKRDLRMLVKLKRKGLDLQVSRLADLFDKEDYRRAIGLEIVEAAKKRIGAHNLGPRAEFISHFELE